MWIKNSLILYNSNREVRIVSWETEILWQLWFKMSIRGIDDRENPREVRLPTVMHYSIANIHMYCMMINTVLQNILSFNCFQNNTCYCIESPPGTQANLPCDRKCPSNEAEHCGGDGVISVYRKGTANSTSIYTMTLTDTCELIKTQSLTLQREIECIRIFDCSNFETFLHSF